MGVTQHSNGPILHGDFQSVAGHRQLHAPRHGSVSLRGHNNVQGASDHGAMPNMLSGYQSVDDPEVRARFGAGWGVSLPSTKGLDNHEMVDAIHQGKLRSMYLCGEEMSIVDSNANYVSEAFRKLDSS
jgi:formate dehydrogenase major subunit